MKRVVVFGIFDGVHDGHRDLFRQALRLAQAVRGSGKPSGSRRGTQKEKVELVVIVGLDEVAQKLKGKKPKHAEDERVNLVQREPLVDNAVLGDRELSTYTILEQCNPDAVCIGYDQDELDEDLRRWLTERGKHIELCRAKPYREGSFHSSLIKGS